MVSQKLTLANAQGFHMRPAGVFAGVVGKFQSDVTVKHNGQDVNGKSLMALVASCIKCGDEIEIVCQGADEQEALAAAVQAIESGLGE